MDHKEFAPPLSCRAGTVVDRCAHPRTVFWRIVGAMFMRVNSTCAHRCAHHAFGDCSRPADERSAPPYDLDAEVVQVYTVPVHSCSRISMYSGDVR
jgi:hypothetical protein